MVAITLDARQTALQRPENATSAERMDILPGYVSAKTMPEAVKQGDTVANTATSISISTTATTSIVITRSTDIADGQGRTMVNITTITECMMSES